MARGLTKFGFDVLLVTVDQIPSGGGFAHCLDDSGREIQVPLTVRPGKGGWPLVGERWLLSRWAGRWIFHAILADPAPIVITAPRDAMDEGTEQIFDALILLGLVSEDGAGFSPAED